MHLKRCVIISSLVILLIKLHSLSGLINCVHNFDVLVSYCRAQMSIYVLSLTIYATMSTARHVDNNICRSIYRHRGYERVYLPLGKVADTPFHIQGDDMSKYRLCWTTKSLVVVATKTD